MLHALAVGILHSFGPLTDLQARYMNQEAARSAKEATQLTESIALGVLQSFRSIVISSDCHVAA